LKTTAGTKVILGVNPLESPILSIVAANTVVPVTLVADTEVALTVVVLTVDTFYVPAAKVFELG
jgi:hypothetical protein